MHPEAQERRHRLILRPQGHLVHAGTTGPLQRIDIMLNLW